MAYMIGSVHEVFIGVYTWYIWTLTYFKPNDFTLLYIE